MCGACPCVGVCVGVWECEWAWVWVWVMRDGCDVRYALLVSRPRVSCLSHGGKTAPAMLSRGRGREGLGRVRSTLHHPQAVVLCLNPAATPMTQQNAFWVLAVQWDMPPRHTDHMPSEPPAAPPLAQPPHPP